MSLTAGEFARLTNLCSLFLFPIKLTEGNPPGALSVLSFLYSMPTIEKHAERRRYGNEVVLQSAATYFPREEGPPAAEFFGRVGNLVIEMQEFPAWWSELTRSPEELVRSYKMMARIVAILRFIGIGAELSAASAGFKEAMKKDTAGGMIKSFIETTLSRLAGKGAVLEGLEIRFGKKIPLQPTLFLFIVAATTLYFDIQEEMRKIKVILMDKLRSGQISNELFSQVYDADLNPNDIVKYWEMK